MSHIVAPSLLAADFLNLEAEINTINSSNADWLHLDVMDGKFVPNISFGMSIIKSVTSVCNKYIDCHLMIVEPEKYISQFADAGVNSLTVHLEAVHHAHRIIQEIKQAGMQAGIAINPHTSVQLLEDIIENLDLVCVMSVNPGFGGQKFIYRTLHKVRQLHEMKTIHNLPTLIEVDGGVGIQNAEKILQSGANVLVAGSSVFRTGDIHKAIDELKNIQPDPSFEI